MPRTLEIRRKSLNIFLHVDSEQGDFIISKFYFNANDIVFQIVEQGQSRLFKYDVSNVTVYDDVNGGNWNYPTILELATKLKELKYTAFENLGEISIGDITDVSLVGLVDGMVLVYDASTSTWVATTVGGISTPNLQQVTTVGAVTNVTTIWESPTDPTNIYIEINTTDNTISFWDKNISAAALGVYTSQALQIQSITGSELSLISLASERAGQFGFDIQCEDIVNAGKNLLTFLDFPVTSNEAGVNIERRFNFGDKPDGTYTIATLDDINGITDGDKGDIVVTSSGTVWTIESALKSAWDSAVTWISTNGANVISAYTWVQTNGVALLGLQAQVNLRTREILQDFTDYTSTGVLTEQIISNQAITANDMKINSWLNFISTFTRTGSATATVSIYLNTTSNSLVGAVRIATTTLLSTQSLPCFKRDFSINASSIFRGLLFSSNAVTDEVAQLQSTTTLTLASTYYLISAVTLNNVADSVTQRAINLKSSK